MAREPAKIHLVAHFHYDPVWIKDQRTYTKEAFELVKQYLEACREDPGYHIMLSELDYLQPFLASHSEHREYVRELIAAGRVSTGGSYSQPNEMTIQGEPLIRNLVYGRAYHEGILSAKPTVYMPLDVFGHCPQLPQIASKAGYQGIVWSKDIVGAPPLCFALSPDGTALLQKHEHYWYHPETFEQFLDIVADGLENQAALGLNHDLRFLGMDMAAPRAWLAGKSAELAQRDPAVVFSTPERYLAAVLPEIQLRRGSIPTTGRDLTFFHMGTPLTRAELKIANRLAENRVLNAEKWATLASLLGAIYPDLALDKAWRQVLFGQHHDAITGCTSDIPHLDLLAGYREALNLATEVADRSLSYIASRTDTASGRRAPRDGAALLVFNPLSQTRTDVCRTRVSLTGALASGFKLTSDSGRQVPFQVVARSSHDEEPWAEIAFLASHVPAIGYHTYYLAPARDLPAAPAFTETPHATIENEHVSITADAAKGAGLTSIYSKALRKELVKQAVGLAGEVIALSEQPDRESPPWEIFTTGNVVRAGDSPAKVEVLQGPVFSRLRFTSALPDRCELIQEVTLYRGLPRIDLRTVVANYRGVHELLLLNFPFDIAGARPTFEDRFAVIVRKPSQGRFDFRTSWHRNYSNCGLGAAQNWVDVGPSPSLALTSGDRRVGALALSPCLIITSPDLRERAAARPLEQALLSRGVTCHHQLDSEDLENDAGHFAFRISLGRRNAYSAKLLEQSPEAAARLADATAKQPWAGVLFKRPAVDGPGLEIPVLVADTNDEGGVVHLANLLAEAIRADDLKLPEAHDFCGLAAPADNHGVAVINRGSIEASLENDGSLAAFLFHTAAWSTYPWGQGMLDRFFVPEHRTHVFEHSLYPHAGDWREGGVVHAGLEVNNPLRAVQAPIAPGVLPTSLSFLSTASPNLVITALKPLGNPLAHHKVTERSRPENGLLIRGYECEGKPCSGTLRFVTAPEQAWLTDLHENKLEEAEITRPGWRRLPEVKLDVPACGIISVAARLTPIAETGPPKELGPSAEPYAPIHARYWDHNLGPAPVGNLPLSLWARGPVPVGKNTRFSLGLSNDALDREISGVVNMIAPPEWTMIPRQLPYRIAPGSQAVYEVMVVVPPEAEPCFIRAATEQHNQTVQDVIPVGDVQPLRVTFAREPEGYSVTIANPNADYVEGHVTLVTPLESWGRAVDSYALTEVTPRLHPFRIEARAEQRFTFKFTGPDPNLWAIAKVAWYGTLQYVQL